MELIVRDTLKRITKKETMFTNKACNGLAFKPKFRQSV